MKIFQSQATLPLRLAACFLCLLAPSAGALTWRDCANQEAGWYRTPEARRVADNVLFFQAEIGGWHKND
ncbi:MAG: hypothetical protein P8R45_03025, partial [Candidatus Binatia bacterium]|nr:hypothetical protein [Candidatus Binatia bacterium]